MKLKLLDSIIFLLITPLTISTIILLFLTFVSTTKFKNKDIVPKDDAMLIMSPEQLREQQGINLIETDFNTSKMSKIERNNMEIFQINEEINEAELSIEEISNQTINNSKDQNSQINEGLDNYNIQSNN